ncbi:hypothetical protein LCC91_07825 [Tepidimonas taiwanensis]|uniref:Uncharacterized protein n=1 Tax=Tepidimonas taiwanensis TaxID=307486 RepID=A0A554XAW3_9BURK|nr:hypothetical protein [Tepidimonas taiwanensis]TSE32982.1 hypothetical protein Ttaiw_00843 [Tepidimonas taiwanensis]UBQ04483.1 hypothetical protein LCC91_07825 [Tepidimonas taiwanensis]
MYEYEHGAYDRFLDRQLDEYCVQYEPRDGLYEALIELGPISALMRYTVRGGVPNEVVGIFLDDAWCERTNQLELVEITGIVEMPDHALLAMADPARDALLQRIDFEVEDYDGPNDY